jgi:uncharacterized protein YbaR (Trm112 family)
MFIELVDILRCPNAHEESWLVLSASRMQERHVIEGELGCHVCQAHYQIRNGIALFRTTADRHTKRTPEPAPDNAAMRLAAFLGLSEPGGVVLLMGRQAAAAPTLEMLVGDTQLVALNAARPLPGSALVGAVSAILAGTPLPLASGSCRGVAIDDLHATSEVLAEAVRVLKAGGRLVLPTGTELPEGITELARDDADIVGERSDGPAALVPLEVRRPK